MSEQLRPDKLTPCTPAELYAALGEAWPKAVPDAACSRGALVLLLAHWALETGFGHACHWYNLGNKKHVPGDGRDFTQFRCNEILGGQVVWISPPDPGCSFVAFDTLEQGCEDYLRGLHRQFGGAWLDAVAGDVPKFCHDLKAERYYTADEAVYTAGVLRCYHQLDAAIPPAAAPTLPEIPPDRSAALDADAQSVADEPPDPPAAA